MIITGIITPMVIPSEPRIDFRQLGNYGPAFAQLPGCFWPWAFFETIGLNMSPLDSFMSNVYSRWGYSTGEFRALHPIVIAVFSAMDYINQFRPVC